MYQNKIFMNKMKRLHMRMTFNGKGYKVNGAVYERHSYGENQRLQNSITIKICPGEQGNQDYSEASKR